MEIIIGTIIIAVFFGISLYFIIGYIQYIRKSKESEKWNCVKGKIIKSEIEPTIDGDVPSLRFNILYEYYVNNEKYTSDRLFYQPFDHNIDYTKKYTVGKIINVYYNPNNLLESVVEKGIKTGVHDILINGVILLIIVIVSLLIFFKL